MHRAVSEGLETILQGLIGRQNPSILKIVSVSKQSNSVTKLERPFNGIDFSEKMSSSKETLLLEAGSDDNRQCYDLWNFEVS